MKLLLVFTAVFWSALIVRAEESDSPKPAAPRQDQEESHGCAPEMRERLYVLAGALGNDGFKARDGCWGGQLEGGARRLAIHLFAGNQYWFCAAAAPEDANLTISVAGPSGESLAAETHHQPGSVAVGVTAKATGQYFVEVARGPSGAAREFCLLYLFK